MGAHSSSAIRGISAHTMANSVKVDALVLPFLVVSHTFSLELDAALLNEGWETRLEGRPSSAGWSHSPVHQRQTLIGLTSKRADKPKGSSQTITNSHSACFSPPPPWQDLPSEQQPQTGADRVWKPFEPAPSSPG